MLPLENSRVKEMYDIVVDYSGHSTLAGLIYVFMPGQPCIGKVSLYQSMPIRITLKMPHEWKY